MTAPRRVSTREPRLALSVPVGVHLRMPTAVWDDALAIGADDLRLLYWDATSWWAQSEHNPHRRITRRQARRYMRDTSEALRILATQGEDAYTAAFAIEPDDARSDWAKTRDEIRDLLRTKHIEIPRGDFSERTLWSLVRKHGLTHRVFEVARADYEAARRAGRRHLTEDDDRRLRFTARMIRAHGDLGPALSGGLSEVAVFWRRESDPDTLLRVRFDYLRRRRIYAFERVNAAGGRDVDAAIRRTIEDGDLEIGRRLAAEAWDQLELFVAAGAVHAWDATGERASVLESERGTLRAWAEAGTPDWFWIFAQMPVDEIGAERGLIIAPRGHRPTGRLWDAGATKIEAGLTAYRQFRDRFALERPWAQVDDAREIIDDDVRIRLKKETA